MDAGGGWIPAYAGMTGVGAGVAWEGVGRGVGGRLVGDAELVHAGVEGVLGFDEGAF